MPRFLHWLDPAGAVVGRSQTVEGSAVEIPAGASHLMVSADEVPAAPEPTTAQDLAAAKGQIRAIDDRLDQMDDAYVRLASRVEALEAPPQQDSPVQVREVPVAEVLGGILPPAEPTPAAAPPAVTEVPAPPAPPAAPPAS